MFRPIALFIGLRYTRAKRNNQFISFISLASILGIALGVIVLITVLSVINGFDREIKSQVFGMISPITVTSYSDPIDHWQQIEKTILQNKGVSATAPFVNGQAMLTNNGVTQPTMLVGVLPQQETGVSTLASKMVKGALADLTSGRYGIVLGEELAEQLGVHIGDTLTVATLKGNFSTTNVTPDFKSMTVVGIFRAGGAIFGFDSKLAYINLHDAQQLLDLGNRVTGLHVNIHQLDAAPQLAAIMQDQIPMGVRAWSWTEQLGGYFQNIQQTKTMMFFIFILIIAVAVFNLVSTMIMVVKTKQSDIAILKTLGATPMTILMIFVVEGLTIGLVGTGLGIAGGILLASNISAISIWIQHVLHMQLISSKIYFVNYLPSQLQWPEVWTISSVALLLSLVATIYPAWRASRTEPVEALRYD